MENDNGPRTLAHGPSDPRERQEAMRELELAELQRWVHTFVNGATPARLTAEAKRLRHLYNDDDLRQIIGSQKRVGTAQAQTTDHRPGGLGYAGRHSRRARNHGAT